LSCETWISRFVKVHVWPRHLCLLAVLYVNIHCHFYVRVYNVWHTATIPKFVPLGLKVCMVDETWEKLQNCNSPLCAEICGVPIRTGKGVCCHDYGARISRVFGRIPKTGLRLGIQGLTFVPRPSAIFLLPVFKKSATLDVNCALPNYCFSLLYDFKTVNRIICFC